MEAIDDPVMYQFHNRGEGRLQKIDQTSKYKPDKKENLKMKRITIFLVLGVLALFVAILFGFFVILLSRTLQNALRSLLQKLSWLPARELIINTLDETFINRRLREDKKMLLQVIVISFLTQTLRIFVNIFAAQSMGIFSFAIMHYFFVIIPIISLLMLVPTPFGVRETIGGVIFGFAGFSVEESVIMLFLATIVCVTGSLVGGVMFLFDKKTAKKDRIKDQ